MTSEDERKEMLCTNFWRLGYQNRWFFQFFNEHSEVTPLLNSTIMKYSPHADKHCENSVPMQLLSFSNNFLFPRKTVLSMGGCVCGIFSFICILKQGGTIFTLAESKTKASSSKKIRKENQESRQSNIFQPKRSNIDSPTDSPTEDKAGLFVYISLA
jgi:hypothetical protein